MTTRDIVLDRIISRVDTRQVPADATATFRYDERGTIGNPGRWFWDDNNSRLSLTISTDADGQTIPDDLNPATIRIQGVDYTVTSVTRPFGGALSLVLSGDTSALAAISQNLGTVEFLGETTMTETFDVTIWARRRDFVGRDLVELTGAGPLTIQDSRFDVSRAGLAEWAINDTFTDDEGEMRRVVGISELGGRGRFLELLARRVG